MKTGDEINTEAQNDAAELGALKEAAQKEAALEAKSLPKAAKRGVLSACVARMKADGLTGKARDDAASHFLAGASAALNAARMLPIELPDSGKYLDVLEALAD